VRWRRHPAAAATGQPRAEVDAFDAKGDALAVLAAAGAPAQALQVVRARRPGFILGARDDPDRAAERARYFGELHPRALEALDAQGPLVAFEVILEKIPEPKPKATRAKPVLELSHSSRSRAISPSSSSAP